MTSPPAPISNTFLGEFGPPAFRAIDACWVAHAAVSMATVTGTKNRFSFINLSNFE